MNTFHYLIKLSLTISLCSTALAGFSSDFITKWDLSKPGSSDTQISFDVKTSGTVNYVWEEIGGTGKTGNGNFKGDTCSISNLPAGSIVRLRIIPTNFQGIDFFSAYDKKRLVDVEQWGSIVWTFIRFWYCSNLNISATDIPDLSALTSMRYLFYGCSSLNGPSNIGTWNTANITDMNGLFIDAKSFNQPIGAWNTGNVTNMSGMFQYATSFNQAIGNWNTGKVTEMDGMFAFDSVFNQAIDTWNTSKVTTMSSMFTGATDFNQPIGNWNTGNVTTMSGMFQGATAFNQAIENWNTGKVRDMISMFQDATSFNQAIGSWNTTMLEDAHRMFEDAKAFNQSLEKWNLPKCQYMFYMLDGSGIDCKNYSNTLRAWAENSQIPNNIALGAANIAYGSDAKPYREQLISQKNWRIDGDNASAENCLSTTDITNQESKSIRMYPNPANQGLTIELPLEASTSIQILSISGQSLRKELVNKVSEVSIDIQDLTPGLYLVRLCSPKGVIHGSFVKE